jgi:hypothetical protein
MRSVSARRMHQTTVRFGPELWEALEEECARLRMSIAQYLREVTLARLVYAAGKRGDPERELALLVAVEREEDGAAATQGSQLEEWVRPSAAHHEPRDRTRSESSEAAALWEQARLVRQRARVIRAGLVQERAARGTPGPAVHEPSPPKS